MAKLTTPTGLNLRHYARLGAGIRLLQLNAERAAILKTFPGLQTGVSALASSGADARPKRKMSAEGRAAISAAAKKMWAARRRKNQS